MASITYKLATEVEDNAIYEAFKTGFSDYKLGFGKDSLYQFEMIK